MSQPHEPTTCQELELHVEALVDGELEIAEVTALEQHLASCPDCARQARLAADIRQGLRELPELDAPAHVLETALKRSRRNELRAWSWTRPWQAPRPAWIALGAATAAALLAVILLIPSPGSTVPESSAEVERATAEARLALAYLDKLTQRAARDLRDDIVQKRVVEPAARGLARSLKPLETESRTDGPISDYRSSDDTTRSS